MSSVLMEVDVSGRRTKSARVERKLNDMCEGVCSTVRHEMQNYPKSSDIAFYIPGGIIGASLSEPHINGTSMRAVFICMFIFILFWYVRHPAARRFIHSVLRPHAMFLAEKSAW